MFDNRYMHIALQEAQKAYDKNEVPIGCVIVERTTNRIIARSHNISERQQNPNLHAEMLAINEACHNLNDKNLSNCDIYITLEPCIMCASAISNARIKTLYYSASNAKQGAVESGIRFYTSSSCFYRPEIYSGLLCSESEAMMKSFFKKLRTDK